MDQQEAISTFQAITNASEPEAKFYLESHNWDLDEATQTYFSTNEVSNSTSSSHDLSNNNNNNNNNNNQNNNNNNNNKSTQSTSTNKPSSSSSPPNRNTSTRGGIRTLSDFNDDHDDHDHDHDHDDDEDDDDKTQRYFTGGEKSGLMVESAPKKNKGQSGDIVNDVFDSAKKHGAVAANEKKVEKPESFDCVGYQLGSTDQGNRNVSKPKEKDPKAVEVKVTFWNQGFTIDDGPLRHYDNPENKELIQDIQRGVVPKELQMKATTPNGLSVTLINNHGQDYVEPPKPRYVAFSGGGQALGASSSPSSNTSTSSTTTTTTTRSTSSAPVSIDSSQPTTTLQIRLANGGRLSSSFNHTHTIQDVINYINNSTNSSQNYDLLTGFPQKPITLPSSTSLKDANLLGALLIQKLK